MGSSGCENSGVNVPAFPSEPPLVQMSAPLSTPLPTPVSAQIDASELVARIHAALPQTQCTRCGYPDCAAYAQAVATGDAAINQCPPGGSEGVQRLAKITGQPALPLNPANGLEAPRGVAVIDEAWCIGCTLCLPACPTDAILGSNKMMHTVIEAHCTGCELCIEVCPVDCISMENVTGKRTGWDAWPEDQAAKALMRYDFHSCSRPVLLVRQHNSHLNPDQVELADAGHKPRTPLHQHDDAAQTKRDLIAAALAKSRAARKNG
jgi:Na+-translocating ferredoxin:NAD+ oxidoreductase subunit B